MKAAPFEYEQVGSVEEAAAHLAELGDEAKVLAGGQSLIPLMAMRLARPAWLVDINALTELSRVDINGMVEIGSLVRQRVAERSPALATSVPLLCEALTQVGHPQIRNRGTIGGSLAHADPAAELPAVVRALDAELVIESTKGRRVVTADEFFTGYFTTALEPEEVLTSVRVPCQPSDSGWCYTEFSRRHGDFAIVGVATRLTVDGRRGEVSDVRIALSGVGSTPVRAKEAEAVLVGQTPTAEAWAAAAETAGREIDPPGDLHGSPDYRRRLTSVLVSTALSRANERIRRDS